MKPGGSVRKNTPCPLSLNTSSSQSFPSAKSTKICSTFWRFKSRVWCSINPTIRPPTITAAIVWPLPTLIARTESTSSTAGSSKQPRTAAGDVSITKTFAFGNCLREAWAPEFIRKKHDGTSSSQKAKLSGRGSHSKSSFIFWMRNLLLLVPFGKTPWSWTARATTSTSQRVSSKSRRKASNLVRLTSSIVNVSPLKLSGGLSRTISIPSSLTSSRSFLTVYAALLVITTRSPFSTWLLNEKAKAPPPIISPFTKRSLLSRVASLTSAAKTWEGEGKTILTQFSTLLFLSS